MKPFSMQKAYNEYFFARCIDAVNGAMFDASGSRTPEDAITVRKGRDLRRELGDRLAANGSSMYTAGAKDLMRAIDEVLYPVNDGGKHLFSSITQTRASERGLSFSPEGTAAFSRSVRSDFMNSFGPGWGFDQMAVSNRKDRGELGHGGYVPLSPYDPDFAYRDAFLTNGPSILYVECDKYLSSSPNPNAGSGGPAYLMMSDDMNAETSVYREVSNSLGTSMQRAGGLYTKSDLSGLSRLRPYMSRSEYQDVEPWMGSITEETAMSGEGVDRAIAILEHLRKDGVPFTVKRDRSPGQLMAQIGNSKMGIRLTDTAKNEKFIGRTYEDGNSMYLSIGDNKSDINPTVEEMLSCIDYSLGKRVNRPGVTPNAMMGASVGSESFYRDRTRPTTFAFRNQAGKAGFQSFFGYHNENGTRSQIRMYYGNNHSSQHVIFQNQEEAETFLTEAVESAKANFERLIDVDGLIKQHEEHKDDPDYTPVFSGNNMVLPIQKGYWDVLTGVKENLEVPDEFRDKELVDQLLSSVFGEDEDDEETAVYSEGVDHGKVYEGTPEENIRAHMRDSMQLMFGQFALDGYGHRFNPALTASFMSSASGVYRNSDNILAAMQELDMNADELIGDDFQTNLLKDKLLKFDDQSARRLDSYDSPFMKKVLETVTQTIEDTGCSIRPEDVLIDENGVISYTAKQVYGRNGGSLEISGKIGQVFEPDKDMVVETKFAGSENRAFTPGYSAYVIPNGPGQNLSLEERTRLSGYADVLSRNLGMQLRKDVRNDGKIYTREDGTLVKEAGTTTSVNNTYRGLFSTRYAVEGERLEGESIKDAYVRESAGKSEAMKELVKLRFETNAGMVKFPAEFKDGSTIEAEYRAGSVSDLSPEQGRMEVLNDNYLEPYELTGRRDIAVMSEEGDGYFDPVFTGSAKNQGSTRYLVRGAKVAEDGRIIPSEDKNARSAMASFWPMSTQGHVPFDRQQMVFSNLSGALDVAFDPTSDSYFPKGDAQAGSHGVRVAQVTLCGDTFDDGCAVSKAFADVYGVRAGDKICDFGGNKSVISRVVDPDMDMEEAKRLGVEKQVAFFKENPTLSVVMAPYSATSRFNAAAFRLSSQAEPLYVNGSVIEDGIYCTPMIITDKKGEEKTKLYDDEEVKAGGGRKASSQLAWAFSAAGTDKILDEFYDSNNSAISNMREMLITMGLDLSETGQLQVGYHPQGEEERKLFRLPNEEEMKSMDEQQLGEQFSQMIGDAGGFLEVPFRLQMPSGEYLQEVPADQRTYPDVKTYRLPVMSSHLRSGRDMVDGTSLSHDYTNQYRKIYDASVRYMKLGMEGQTGADVDKKSRICTRDAFIAYDSITSSLKNRKFTGKYNVLREDIMTNRLPYSATAVWVPHAELDIDQIAMNGKMMHTLGVKEGDYTLMWRDPILREDGVRYMRVKRDDSLSVVAVNPLIAEGLNGDFDGDSVGLRALKTEAAKQQAMDHFSVGAMLLDTTHVRENGDFKLNINTGMDVCSAEYNDKKSGSPLGLEERRMGLERAANDLYRMTDLTREERLVAQQDLVSQISDWARETVHDSVASAYVKNGSLEEHLESLSEIVNSGAKGSMSKLKEYARYLGAEYDTKEDGSIDCASAKLADHDLVSRSDIENTEFAVAVKSYGTALAGMVSQRLVTVSRNSASSEGLRLTFLATQGVLQSKHDPVLAKQQYGMLHGALRNLWRGRDMQPSADGGWSPVKDRDGNFVQATPQRWVELFDEIHASKHGMNVAGEYNMDHVKKVAEALTDPKTGRMMDLEDDATKQRFAAPMDYLAYGCTFDKFVTMAKAGANLFEGTYNSHFAPANLGYNLHAAKDGEVLKTISEKDVRKDFAPKAKRTGYYSVKQGRGNLEDMLNNDVKEKSVPNGSGNSPEEEKGVTRSDQPV